MNEPYKARPGDLAGFDVYGVRQKDGQILMGSSDPILVNDFPDRIEAVGMVTLEYVKNNDVPDDHPGAGICWGIYV